MTSCKNYTNLVCKWYAGGYYSGVTQKTTFVTTTIAVPSGAPETNKLYYVVLSVFDNNGSYDQIGIANIGLGYWGIEYSYTTGNCPNLIYHDGVSKAIAGGYSYDFQMWIINNHVDYIVAYHGGSILWRGHVGTSYPPVTASWFVVDGANPYSCGAPYGYSVYEVAYMHFTTAVPKFDFLFTHNVFANFSSGKDQDASWLPYVNGPAPSSVSASVTGSSKSDLKVVN